MKQDVSGLTGKIFGKWSVGQIVEGKKHTIYTCVCTCGKSQEIRGSHLLRGTSTQCRKCGSSTPRIALRLESIGKCKKGHDIFKTGTVNVGKNKMCALCRWSTYILRTYGLTVEEYLEIYELQNGKCAICHKELMPHPSLGINKEGKRIEIDHKHTPKKLKPQPLKRDTVRGLLCGGRYAGCNRKLGHVDNIEWLKAAAIYLENPPAQQIRTK